MFQEISRRLRNLLESIPVTPPSSPFRGSVQASQQHMANSKRRNTRNLLIVASLVIITMIQILSLFNSSSAPSLPRSMLSSSSHALGPSGGRISPLSRNTMIRGGGHLHPNIYPTHQASEELTLDDRIEMEKLFQFGNFTSFVKLSDKTSALQKKSTGASVAIPCLWSEMLQKNIYLIPGGWDQTSSRASNSDSRHTCPKPSGGQLPPPLAQASPSGRGSSGTLWGVGFSSHDQRGTRSSSEYQTELTFIVSVVLHKGAMPHMVASIALEAAIALFRHADEISSCEFIFIDHTSSPGSNAAALDLTELKEFLSFLQHAFNLDIKFIQGGNKPYKRSDSKSGGDDAVIDDTLKSDSSSINSGGDSYLDLISLATQAARGKYIMFLEADNIIQPNSLFAMSQTFESHAETAIVVPLTLRSDGKVHYGGGLVSKEGDIYMQGNKLDQEHYSINYVREVEFGTIFSASMVKTSVFLGLGLPDSRFRPGFYADVDACFSARSVGWRVLLQPFAQIIHYDPNPSLPSTQHKAASGAMGDKVVSPHGFPSDVVYSSKYGLDSGRSTNQQLLSSFLLADSQRAITLSKNKFVSKWQVQLKCYYTSSELEALFKHASESENSGGGVQELSAADASFGSITQSTQQKGFVARQLPVLAEKGRFGKASTLNEAIDQSFGSSVSPSPRSQSSGTSSHNQLDPTLDPINGLVPKINHVNRLKLFSVLFVDWIAPETDRDSGSIRARYMLQILLALRCEVTFVAVDQNRPPHYRDDLRYMGIRVMKLKQLKLYLDSAAACPFDAIILSRRDSFKAAYSIVADKCCQQVHDLSNENDQATLTTVTNIESNEAVNNNGSSSNGKINNEQDFEQLDSRMKEEEVGPNWNSAVTIFDTVDLHFLREKREAVYNKLYKNSQTSIFGNTVKSPEAMKRQREQNSKASKTAAEDIELGFISMSHVTLVVSPFEIKEIASRVPFAPIKVVSNIHILDPTMSDFSSRKGVVFTGNFNHLPNRDAILFFAQEILPIIHPKVGPDFVFHVIGSNHIPDSIKRLNGTMIDGVVRIIIHGFVADLKSFYDKMRIAVVPLRWGAGVKGKVNSAMSHGVPVVCTTIAQEGMFLVNGQDALVEDNPVQFAHQIVELYSNPSLWNKLRSGGFENIQKHFSISNAVRGMLSTFEVILSAKSSSSSSLASLSDKDGTALEVSSSPLASDMSPFLDGLSTPAGKIPQVGSSLDLHSHKVLLWRKISYGACALNAECSCSEGMLKGRTPLV